MVKSVKTRKEKHPGDKAVNLLTLSILLAIVAFIIYML